MTDQELQQCFAMPSGNTITGRISSIKNVFVAAIVPLIPPSSDELRQVLELLQMQLPTLHCSYCGDHATEWDHLYPLVNGGKPTGYPSSIRNLVPSCGKCNQSKGKRIWREWMISSAKRSPATRMVRDLDAKIKCLEAFENWANCNPIKIEQLVDPSDWKTYYLLQDEIVMKMREAQLVAVKLSGQVTKALIDCKKSAAHA